MISVITCVSDRAQYEQFSLPVLLRTSEHLVGLGLRPLQLITVSSNHSIGAAYNEGTRLARHQIKAYMHQDVDLLDVSWAYKLLAAFANNPSAGLVGLVGTRVLGDRGFWWESGREHALGELYSGLERADWSFRPVDGAEPAECVDGFFMASRLSLPWDERLGFHLYDMDMSRAVRKEGYGVLVLGHKAWHIGAIRDQKIDWAIYNRKWGLPHRVHQRWREGGAHPRVPEAGLQDDSLYLLRPTAGGPRTTAPSARTSGTASGTAPATSSAENLRRSGTRTHPAQGRRLPSYPFPTEDSIHHRPPGCTWSPCTGQR